MKETQCSIAHIILEYRARCKEVGLNRINTTDILYFPLEIEKLSQLDGVYVQSKPLDDSLRLCVIMIANQGMKQNSRPDPRFTRHNLHNFKKVLQVFLTKLKSIFVLETMALKQ
ncbi:hypothetical protein ACOME3_007546 [Neoechinorhynchus agilis]